MKYNKIRIVDYGSKAPKFAKIQSKFGLLLGIIFWVLAFVLFLFLAYVSLFQKNLIQLLQLIKPKQYYVPFWFSVLCTIFFFPLTLFLILIVTITNFFRD